MKTPHTDCFCTRSVHDACYLQVLRHAYTSFPQCLQAGLVVAGLCYSGMLPLRELASMLDAIVCRASDPQPDATSKHRVTLYAVNLYLQLGATLIGRCIAGSLHSYVLAKPQTRN